MAVIHPAASPRLAAGSRQAAALLAIFAVALGARWAFALASPPGSQLASVDALGYHVLAVNLLEGHGFSLNSAAPFVSDAIRTPLYPLFVAGVYALSGRSPLAVALVQGLIDAVTAALVAATARQVGGGWLGAGPRAGRLGMAAGLLYALNPIAWRYCNELLTEIPLAAVLAGLLWAFVRHVQGMGWRWLALAGLLAGLAVLVKPNAAPQPLVLALAALLAAPLAGGRPVAGRTPRGAARRLLLRIGLPLVIAAAVLAPWVLRNCLVFGRCFLSHAFENNLARVSAVAALARAGGERVAPWTPRWEALYSGLLLEAESRFGAAFEPVPRTARQADLTQRQLAAVAADVLRRHPASFAWSHLAGFAGSWVPQEHRFWYAALSGRPWESVAAVEGAFGQAVDRGRAGGLIAALRFLWQARVASLPPLALALWWGWLLAYGIAAVGVLRGTWRLRHAPALLLLCWGTILYTTFLPGPIAHVRFQLPIMPLLLLLAAVGLWR